MRASIATGAALVAVALYFRTAPVIARERMEKLCREQIWTSDPARIKAEPGDTGESISQTGTHILYEWWTIGDVEETDDAIYFYTRDGSCFALRVFESGVSRQQFLESAGNHIVSAAQGSLKSVEDLPGTSA